MSLQNVYRSISNPKDEGQIPDRIGFNRNGVKHTNIVYPTDFFHPIQIRKRPIRAQHYKRLPIRPNKLIIQFNFVSLFRFLQSSFHRKKNYFFTVTFHASRDASQYCGRKIPKNSKKHYPKQFPSRKLKFFSCFFFKEKGIIRKQKLLVASHSAIKKNFRPP